jgi:hypothetical protein
MKHISHRNQHFSLSSIEQVRLKVEEDYPRSIMQNRHDSRKQEPGRQSRLFMITECSCVKDMICDRTIESFCPCERCFLIQERRLIRVFQI